MCSLHFINYISHTCPHNSNIYIYIYPHHKASIDHCKSLWPRYVLRSRVTFTNRLLTVSSLHFLVPDFNIAASCRLQNELTYYVKGAIEQVLRECSKYSYRGAPLPLSSKQMATYQQQAARMGRVGLRG